jgi:hypothetical protein
MHRYLGLFLTCIILFYSCGDYFKRENVPRTFPIPEYLIGVTDFHETEVSVHWSVDFQGWETSGVNEEFLYFYFYIDGHLTFYQIHGNNSKYKSFDLDPRNYDVNPDDWHSLSIRTVVKGDGSMDWKNDKVKWASKISRPIKFKRYPYQDGIFTSYSWKIENDWKFVPFDKEYSGRVRIAKRLSKIDQNGNQRYIRVDEPCSGAQIWYHPMGDGSCKKNGSTSGIDGYFKVMGPTRIAGIVCAYYEEMELIDYGGAQRRVMVAYRGYAEASSIGACLISLYPVEIGEF